MTTSPRSKKAALRSSSARPAARGPRGASKPKARKAAKRSAIDTAIASELAPAVAIALLAKTDQSPESPAPALDCLGAGVSASEDEGKVRVQLVFDSGAVLPVEMSVAAGEALSTRLSEELDAKK